MRPGADRSRRPLRFALVGVANTLLGLAVIYALKWAAGVPDLPANLLGYAAGLSLSYVLNARWTFEFRGRHALAVPRFLITVAIAYVANLAAVYAALGLSFNGYVAQAVGVVPYAIVSYLGTAWLVFRNRDAADVT